MIEVKKTGAIPLAFILLWSGRVGFWFSIPVGAAFAAGAVWEVFTSVGTATFLALCSFLTLVGGYAGREITMRAAEALKNSN